MICSLISGSNSRQPLDSSGISGKQTPGGDLVPSAQEPPDPHHRQMRWGKSSSHLLQLNLANIEKTYDFS